MQVGDYVTSGISGYVKAIEPCNHNGCEKLSFTLDNGKSRGYHHADSFVVVEDPFRDLKAFAESIQDDIDSGADINPFAIRSLLHEIQRITG